MLITQNGLTQNFTFHPFGDNYLVDSLKIIPEKAYEGDMVKLVAFTTHFSGGCGLLNYRIWKFGSIIIVDATYEQGMLTYICHSTDTLNIGRLPAGSYFLLFDWRETIDFDVYPNQQACKAYFTYSYLECLTDACVNTVAFRDSSQGNVIEWKWDFGDGQTSDQQNPVHTFSRPGVYNVCLTIVTDDGCTSVYCEKVRVGPYVKCKAFFEVIYADCYSAFREDCISNFVAFLDKSYGDVKEWYWDFGDGQTSGEQNPVHEYEYGGVFNVCLTIKTYDGCTDTYCDSVFIYNPWCKADFSWEEIIPFWDCNFKSTDCITPYYYVQFMDESVGEITSWKWDFGDGSVSHDQNPFHEYKFSGEYEVCLYIRAKGCCSDSICKTIFIGDTLQWPCVADFTTGQFTSPCPLCIGCYCVKFLDQSSWNTVEWSWDFGDGDTSSLQNPEHIYFWLPGEPLFTVCLAIKTSDHCTDTICKVYDPESDSLYTYTHIDDHAVSGNIISIYPNPADNEIFIELSPDINNKECLLTIVDMYGRKVDIQSYYLTATSYGSLSYNVAKLDNGQYICLIVVEDKLYVGRFAVNK